MRPTKKRRVLRRILILLVLAVLAGGYGWWSNITLQTAYFDPAFSDLPAGFDGCRIAVLSDLHGAEFGEDNAALFDAVAAERPDYIFYLGDLEDRYRGPAAGYPEQVAEGLCAIAPTYYVTGNHEWAIGGVPELKERLTEHGVTVLSNEALVLERNGDALVLAGIDDPNGYADQKTPEELAAQEVEDLLASLTLEEKVGQLFFVRVPDTDAVSDVSTYHLGGYILFGRDTADKTADALIQTIQSYQDAAAVDTGIPLLIGVDEEGGTVVRVSSNPHLRASKFPSPQKAYASGGMEAVLADTREKDLLLSALGFNVNLSPVADVSTNPADFMYDRTFGQDAAATADYVAQVVSQMAEDGMGSVLKHFPGYGNNVDTHTGIAVDQRPLESFTSSDFLPFQAGMESGGGKTAVLVSHNIMTAVDGDLPASLSPKVHGLLRTDLGFDGVVMTDDLAMEAVAAYSADGAVAVMALEAGNDLVITTDYRTQIPKVLEALESGALSEETIDTACRRVLTWKQNLGLL